MKNKTNIDKNPTMIRVRRAAACPASEMFPGICLVLRDDLLLLIKQAELLDEITGRLEDKRHK